MVYQPVKEIQMAVISLSVESGQRCDGEVTHIPTARRELTLEKHRFRCGYVDNFTSAPG